MKHGVFNQGQGSDTGLKKIMQRVRRVGFAVGFSSCTETSVERQRRQGLAVFQLIFSMELLMKSNEII